MTVRRLAYLSVIVLGTLFSAVSAAEERVALVIGNSAYRHASTLANPKNDALDIAAALKKVGFQVIEGHDVDKSGMDRTIHQFARALKGAHVGLFFYAGHGIQVDGQNYLVPIDAKLEDASGLDFETVRIEVVHRAMERATKTNLIFLDACRDNPLSRNLARALGTRSTAVGKGLAPVESGEGTLISFSTQPGNVAADGHGRNSPYATALVRQLADPKDDLSTMLIEVRNQVIQQTARRQVPWEHSALTSRFYFSSSKTPTPHQLPGTYEQQAELAFWASVRESGDAAAIQTYIDRFPQGTFASLARVMVERLKAEAAQSALAKSSPPEPERSTCGANEIEQNGKCVARAPPKAGPKARTGTTPSTANRPIAGALRQEPPAGTLPHGQTVLVDDNSCPSGHIKQITGGNNKLGVPRQNRCIRR